VQPGCAPFALTPEGAHIYAQTAQLFAAADAFRAGVDEIHQRMGGRAAGGRVRQNQRATRRHIYRAIALFSQAAPDVALSLHVGTLTAIERGVLDGQFQVWHHSRPPQLQRTGLLAAF
jgi:DNA-binding transcriptional LysR family regulator